MTQPASKRLLTEAAAAAQASNPATPLGAALNATYALNRIPAGIAAPGQYLAEGSLFNLNASNMRRWRAKLAAARAGTGLANLVMTGTSLTLGVGSGVRPNLASAPADLTKLLEASGIPIAGTGVVNTNNNNGEPAQDGRWILNGWARADVAPGASLHMQSTAVGSVATFTSDRPGTIVEVNLVDGPGGGTCTVSVDGGAAQTITNTATSTLKATQVTGLANTVHTVVITVTAGTVYLQGAQVRRTTGVTVSNAGIGSSKSAQWAPANWYQAGAMVTSAAYSPDLLTIEGPVNDALNSVPIATAKANYNTIIANFKATKASVLLVLDQTPINTFWNAGYTILTDAVWGPYRQMFYDLAAQNNLPLLDLGDALGPQVTWLDNGMNSDGIHMNANGYYNVAALQARAILG